MLSIDNMALRPRLNHNDQTVYRGDIVWLKKKADIDKDLLERYQVPEGAHNHPALIIGNPMFEDKLRVNEIMILTVSPSPGVSRV